MDIINRRPGLAALVAFIAGLIIGLVVLGWGLFPVEYSGADPSGLFPEYQALFVRNAAELYSFDNNQDKLRNALSGWQGDVMACELAQNSLDPADQQRLVAAATIVNGAGCGSLAVAPGAQATTAGVVPGAGTAAVGTVAVGTAAAPGATVAVPGATTDEGGNILPLILGLLLLVLLGAAAFYVLTRRRALMAEDEGVTEAAPGAAPAVRKTSRPSFTRPNLTAAAPAVAATAAETAAEASAVPIARFRTAYTRGHDTYDDSFSIESANGDFLGECGVGIAEAVGAATPRNVTAFEVWLFDKNDIRTITKVIMSDHAFFDEALKAKLAPKGEPVLARPNETIILETATLIINAEITEMEYGESGDMPDGSYFDRFTIELSAWAKEGDYVAPPAGDDEEDLLNY
jgi:hypothetical protein